MSQYPPPPAGPGGPNRSSNPFAAPEPSSSHQPPPWGDGPVPHDPLGWGDPGDPRQQGRPAQFDAPDPLNTRPTQQFGHQMQYGNQAPHDPTTAFGAPPPATVSIDDFAEPKSRAQWIVWGVVGLVVVALLATALTFKDRLIDPNGGTSPTAPSSGPATTPVPSAVLAGRAVEFETRDGARGYWEITDQQWTTGGLLKLSVVLRIDSGRTSFGFFAMEAKTTDVYDPTTESTLPSGTLAAGNQLTGTVVFQMPRGTTMVVLTDSTQRQTATLEVKG